VTVSGPRIALVHALEESIAPARAAVQRCWPEAFAFDVFDSALAPDLAAAGALVPEICERVSRLGRYAADSQGTGGATAGILFTCSAFGPAIEAVQRSLPIPVLKPNEAAFEEALARGSRIGLVVSFGPSGPSLRAELEACAQARGAHVDVQVELAEGALAALKAGDAAGHDARVAAAAARFHAVDAVVLGQFSLARAATAVSAVLGEGRVLTTPDCAVQAIRRRVGER
jgi:Asp/Glu/hydantoin racemase